MFTRFFVKSIGLCQFLQFATWFILYSNEGTTVEAIKASEENGQSVLKSP